MRATKEATEKFADDADLAAVGFTTLGRTGLSISRLGFGTYRVDDRIPQQQEALTAALLQGVNLIDTASNYSDGHAEQAVGAVLSQLIGQKKIARDQVVVVSKVGLVQGTTLAEIREREADDAAFPGMVHFQDGLWFDIHPSWISEQLDASLKRLQLDSVDVLMLHNPETFLADAETHRKGVPLEKVREQLYAKIRKAFEALEAEAEKGRIGWYGVTSNTFAAPADHAQALSVRKLVEIAREVAKTRTGDPEKHRFAAIQLPVNLFENRPVLAKVGNEGTPLEEAKAAGIAVLANRPLNAVLGPNRVVRITDAPPAPEAPPLAEAAAEVQAIEAVFAQDFAPRIKVQGGPPATEIFRWGHELADAPQKVTGLEHWMAMQAQIVGPQIQGMLNQLGQGFKGDVAFQTWGKRYVESLNRLLAAVSREVVGKMAGESAGLRTRVESAAPAAWKGATLSRQAIATLLATDGITSVLVGMRRKPYVDDALGAVGLAAPESVRKIYEAFSK